MKKINKICRGALAWGLTAALAGPTSAASPAMTQIGAAAAVHGLVRAFTAPDSPGKKPVGRDLKSGQPLYLNDKLTTGPDSSMQVMLKDETVFTIGPNSSMVLDEFTYDPKSHSGKVTATVQNGVFRFVTGQIGHNKPSDMKVKFPVGTMGIRGTIVAGEVGPNGTTAVLLGPGPANNAPGERVGAFSLENAGTKVDVVKPGFGTHIDGAGGIPSVPAAVPLAQLNNLLGAMAPDTARPAPEAPSDDGSKAPAPAPGQSAAAPSGDSSSVSSDAGQETADAAGDLSDTQNVASVVGDTGLVGQNAATDIDDATLFALLNSYQDTWDAIQTVTSGTGQYAGSGSFNLTSCGGAACSVTGTMSLLLDIDFGKQTIGSAASKVSVTEPVNIPGGDSVSFAQQSYAGMTGAAVLSGTSASGNLNASVSLLNITGIASHAAASAQYSNAAGTVGSGNILVPINCTSGTCKP